MTTQEKQARRESTHLQPFLLLGEDVIEAVRASNCAGYVLEKYYADSTKEPPLQFEPWVRAHFRLDKVVECELVIPDDPGVLIDGPEPPRIDGIATDEDLGLVPIHIPR